MTRVKNKKKILKIKKTEKKKEEVNRIISYILGDKYSINNIFMGFYYSINYYFDRN